MKYLLSIFILFTLDHVHTQTIPEEATTLLFWTAQDWPCEFLDIKVYNVDSTLVGKTKLRDKFTENRIPDCTDSKVTSIDELSPGFHFFIAECYKEKCYVCHGDGSYWQATIQDKTIKTTGIKMDGTWKTCHVCQGDGASTRTLWIDTLTLSSQQCRSILLK